MKRKILSVFSIIFALICTLAVFAACTESTEQIKPEPGPETGEYYYAASDGTDYLLNLFDGDQFTLKIASENLAGSYKADGEVLTLTPDSAVGAIAATYRNDVVTLVYNEVTYRFLRSILYTVSFDTNGADAIASVKVLNGKTVARPDAPSKAGLVFVGWYSDSAFLNEYNFNAPVTADLTLHARFVAPLDPEFTVSFNTNGASGEEFASQQTVGHKIFDLPTPVWTGHTFVGWWVSQYDSADMLSYEYDEQELLENTTLYAVWDTNTPNVSVTESGVVWTAYSGNNSYQLKITAPDGTVEERTVGTNSYSYDFASKAEGDYVVEVTFNGNAGTAYYKNKGLARVSVFEVENSTLLFNSVPNAEHYYITVVCGSSDHSHVEVDLGTETSFIFDDCDMRDGGITFVVTAAAEGYVSSQSATFTFQRTLDSVAGFTVDPETEVVSWGAVSRATSYYLTVTVNGTQVYSGNVGLQIGYSLKYANSGEVVVEVTPIARGWSSPAASVYTYQKVRLATPTGIALSGSTVVWNEVEGARGYEVTFDGATYQTNSASYDLPISDVDASGLSHVFTVRALGSQDAQTSLSSDPFVITSGEMGEVSYNAGVVTWDAVFGIDTFAVKVNDGNEEYVSGVNFLAVTLTQEGENVISVCAIDAEGNYSEWVSVSVTAWAISFDSQNGVSVGDVYRAAGDPLNLPETTRYGYTFASWNDAPTGGSEYTDPYFNEGRNITLYAVWTANVYTVSFDVGSYSDDVIESVEVTFGQPFTFKTPESNDITMTFRGWYSSANAAGEQYTDYTGAGRGTFFYAGNITLTAAWVAIYEFVDNGSGYTISKGPGINYVKEITIPVMYRNRLVTTVGNFQATNIERINIPNTIRTVTLNEDAYAFQNCAYLTYINIYDSGLSTDQVYYDVDGVLFYYNEAAGTGRMEIRYYPYARSESEYTIPSTIRGAGGEVYYVTTIPSGAFYSYSYYNTTSLTRINIPATVSLIEQYAFYNYYYMTDINFLPVAGNEPEANGLDIRQDAFIYTLTAGGTEYQARITHLTLPKRFSVDNPRDVFGKMTYLAYVDVEAGGVYSSVDGLLVKDNREYGLELVFYPSNRHLDESGNAIIPEDASTSGRATTFTVPDGIFAIGEEAFLDNSTLKTVVIPGHVRYIGVSAFQGHRLTGLTFLGEKDDLDLTIDDRAFLGENWTLATSPNIPSYTTTLTSLTLPANLTKLGQSAFGSLGGIRNDAAAGLHEVTVNVERDAVNFSVGAFTGTIAGSASSASHITTLHFGAGVPAFEILDVFGSNVRQVYVDEANPNYWSDPNTGVLYDGTRSKLILFPGDWEGPYEIPEGITNIQSGMFMERTGLTEIIIHNGVTRVGNDAFKGCTALETVTFRPGNDDVELVIEETAFSGCSALTTVELPDRTVSIGHQAFSQCTALTSFTIPKGVKALGMSGIYGDLEVFYSCNQLKELKVAEGNTNYAVVNNVLYTLRAARLTPEGPVTYVPDRVLYVPTGVEGEVTVSGYIRSVGQYAFSRAYTSERSYVKITKVIFEDVIETYDPDTGEAQSSEIDFNVHDGSSNGPFNYISTLLEVHFPKGMTKMPAYLFIGCTYLEKVNVPNTVTSINANAFTGGGSYITTFTFDDGGTEGLRIEDGYTYSAGSAGGTNHNGLFGGMSRLTTIELPARLTYIGSYAFHNLSGEHSETNTSNVEKIVFPEEFTHGLEIGSYAFYYTKKLQSLALPEGIVSLADHAFNQSGISSITLPESLTTIGAYAFSYCSSLTSIDFPVGLKTIESYAFQSTKLESITLNEGLETIGTYAFSGITTLTGVLAIPASVTTIDNYAFNNTRLTKVTTAEDNKLAVIGNSAFAANPELKQFVFGNTTTALTFGASVFSGCTSLTSFEFPTNVLVIGDSMFANLTTLTSVTFAEGTSKLERVDQLAFSKTGLSEIAFPESSSTSGIALGSSLFKSCTAFTSMYLSASITQIDGVLNGCATIKTITINENNTALEADPILPIIYEKVNGERGAIKLVYGEMTGRFDIAGGTSIGASAFANQTELEIVFIPASVRTIGDYAFQNCVNLKQVIIEEGSVLQSIGSGAFMNCYKLESINLEDAKSLTKFGDGKYAYTPAADHNGVFMFAGIQSENPLKITFPASVETVGTYMFTNSGAVEIDMSAATGITELHTGTGTASYGGVYGGFFSGSTKLTSIKLPSSITFLGTYTFAGCTALREIDLSDLTGLEKLSTGPNYTPTASSYYANYLFTNCSSLETVTFPTSLKYFGGRAFEGCSSLTTIEGTENVTLYSPYAFAGSGLVSVTVSGTPSNFMFLGCESLRSITFEGITSLTATNLFQNCTALETVDLSDLTGLASLPNYMFAGCSNLKNVSLPAGSMLTHLGQYTFQDCTSLERIDLSGLTGLTRFSSAASTAVGTSTDSYIFDGCTNLKQVILPASGFIQIGGYAFRNCTSLTELDLTGITIIGRYAFQGSGLKSVTIPASTTAVYAAAFADCLDLTDITFEEGAGTVALTAGSLTYSSGAMSTPGVFARSGVKNVTFSSRLTTLTIATFAYCLDLEEITLPASLTGTMGASVFYGCENLKTIDMSAMTIASLGNYMFINCYNLKTVKLGANMNYLGTYTFQNCTSLESIDISGTRLDRFSTTATANVATSAVYTFAGCVNLREVIMKPGQIKQVGPYTFLNCESLESFDFSGITHLSAGAFQNAGLTGTVTLPNTLTYFNVASGLSPFSGCGNVEKFEVEEGNTLLTSVEGALVLNSTGALILLPGGATVESDVLDLNDAKFAEVTLGGYLFSGISNIKKVILPDGLTEIPAYLFAGSGVEEIVVPASVTSIGTNAFANTYNLKTVTFLEPEEGEEAAALTFAAGSTSATGTTGVFYGSAVDELVLPERLVDIPTGTFMYTTRLSKLVMPGSIAKINNYVFYGSATQSLHIGDGVTEIGTYVYSHTTGLTDLTPEDFKNVTTVGNYAFEYSSVKNVEFSNTVVSAGTYLFQYSEVENVKIPGSVVTIGNFMFNYCDKLVSVVIEDLIDEEATRGTLSGTFRYSSLQSIELGKGATTLTSTFLDCVNLTSVKVPEGVTSMSSAFQGCTNLTSLELPDTLTTIGTQSFAYCTSLKSIVIPESVTSIALGSTSSSDFDYGTSPFAGWTSEQSICFTSSRSYVSALLGLAWVNHSIVRLPANLVFNYVPEA